MGGGGLGAGGRGGGGGGRRYYKVTEKGMAQLNLYKEEWKTYSGKISGLFEGEVL